MQRTWVPESNDGGLAVVDGGADLCAERVEGTLEAKEDGVLLFLGPRRKRVEVPRVRSVWAVTKEVHLVSREQLGDPLVRKQIRQLESVADETNSAKSERAVAARYEPCTETDRASVTFPWYGNHSCGANRS